MKLPTVPRILLTVEDIMQEHSENVLAELEKHIKEMESENESVESMQVLLYQQNQNGLLH